MKELEKWVENERNIAGKAQNRADRVEKQNKRYREALEFADDELMHVLHSNKSLDVKMFYAENAKKKITEVLEGEEC